MTFEEMQLEHWKVMDSHGFHDDFDVCEKLLLVVTEVAEATEEVRDGNMATYFSEGGKPEGYPSELADVVLRVMDMAQQGGIDLAAEIRQKIAYNKTRPFKHGRKF